VKLTDKQAAFCREYTKDFNGSAAARRAGYSATTSDVQAFKLLSRPHVKAEILRLQAELAASARVTVKTLLVDILDGP
jgi:phage terminase small subunit